MTTIEGNKMIAESPFAADYTKATIVKMDKFEGNHDRIVEFAQYHKNWNLLMPVVEKIESLGFDSRILADNDDNGYLCDFVDADNKEASCETSYESKINAVWLAVVQFIQWYNQNLSPIQSETEVSEG